MRKKVVDAIVDIAKYDSRIVFVTGDLGYNVLTAFEQLFPERYINVGISEQNMAAVSAGLALEGHIVFMYSIGNFPTLRCIEQIRNDICYHNANVKILSVGGGMSYGDLGMSHHATEDMAMMRALPNMRVYAPADSIEAVLCLNEAYKTDGPAFIRMEGDREKQQHPDSAKMEIDIHSIIPFGPVSAEVNILTTGTILAEGLRAKDILGEKGISAGVISVPRIKPIDVESIKQLARTSKMLVTLEEHNILGGLGGAVAEVVSSDHVPHAVLLRLGLQDEYTSIVGDQEYLRNFYGISGSRVAETIEQQYQMLAGKEQQ